MELVTTNFTDLVALLAASDKFMAARPATASAMHDHELEAYRLDFELKALGFKSIDELRTAVQKGN